MKSSLKTAWLTAIGVLGIAVTNPILGHEGLIVVSWGGAYTKSQILAYIEPYEDKTGTTIYVEDYDGGLKEISAQVESYNTTWDMVDLDLADATRGCEEGLLEKIDHSILPPAPDGTPAKEDFLPGTLPECAVGQVVWSTIVAYDGNRFRDNPPQTIVDFFDIEKFPGNRGLRKSPRVNMEWALLADGVPIDKVYETLSTEEGLERAFAKLETIKRHVVWWESGSEPPQLLADGQVAMTSAWNGRIYNAIVEKDRDFVIIWDGQVWDFDLWGVPKRTRTQNLDEILDFIKFATATERLAEQSKYIAYGPARKSSMALVSEDIKPYLPTAPENARNALKIDAQWWAENEKEITRRFETWSARKLPFTYQYGP